MGGTQDVYGCGARMCTGAARKCIWGGGGVAGGPVTPTDPLQSVPLLPPPAGSDGGELGQGPIHIDPAPHIHGPHCARRPTVRDGWPTLLIPSFTFTSLSDPVLILWCPSQPSADGMRRGGRAPGSCVASVPPPGGGQRFPPPPTPAVCPRLDHGVFPGGFTPGARPLVPPLVRPQGSGVGAVGNGAPAPHGVSQRAPPSPAHDPLAPTLLPRLRGGVQLALGSPWPSSALAVPACCRRPDARCGSPARPTRGTPVLASASRVPAAQAAGDPAV